MSGAEWWLIGNQPATDLRIRTLIRPYSTIRAKASATTTGFSMPSASTT
ncbi:hypothetical protein ABH926_003540 [Catenulispora sp. GP43]